MATDWEEEGRGGGGACGVPGRVTVEQAHVVMVGSRGGIAGASCLGCRSANAGGGGTRRGVSARAAPGDRRGTPGRGGGENGGRKSVRARMWDSGKRETPREIPRVKGEKRNARNTALALCFAAACAVLVFPWGTECLVRKLPVRLGMQGGFHTRASSSSWQPRKPLTQHPRNAQREECMCASMRPCACVSVRE